jgi:stalled ribosome rescue protein Dom34
MPTTCRCVISIRSRAARETPSSITSAIAGSAAQQSELQRSDFMTSHHFHAVVWIDHHEARVCHFSPTDVDKLVLHPDHPTRHIHHKANSIGSGHAAEDHAFLQAVAQSIADAGAVLITGPANAKTELVKHISQHDPQVIKKIVAVETVDHPSDGELVAHARHYFKVEDRMLPQRD